MKPGCAGRPHVLPVLLLLLAGLSAAPARAESTRFYELEGFPHLLEGNPESTAITEDGAVALPAAVHERLADAGETYSAATAWGDDLVVALADSGEVLAVSPKGVRRSLYRPEAGVVTALLAVDDVLWVATAPPGQIVEVNRKGASHVLCSPEANFIWNMVPGPDKTFLISTGEPGQVLRMERSGKAQAIFKPEQTHLRALAYDAKLGTFVGGAERGIVYRAADNRDFRALFDTTSPEITSLLLREDAVYVAAVSGAANLVGNDGKNPGKGGDVQSQLVRLQMDGSFEVLAGSNDEAIFATAFDRRGSVLVATGATGREDPRGRLYSIDPQRRRIALVHQSPSRRLTHLVPLPGGGTAVVAAAGGRVLELSADLAREGAFVTAPFDAAINASFGWVQALGVYPRGTEALMALRSGQTARPDASWSPWSKALAAPGQRASEVPRGRYLQVRLQLRGNGQATPLVQRLRVAYRRQNLPPFVRDLSVLPKDVVLQSLPRDEARGKTVALNDKGEVKPDEGRRSIPARVRQYRERGALTLRWTADDLNGDELVYDLFIRGIAERDWRLLKSELREPFYTLQSTQLPDGHYVFRVRVSDAPDNPPGLERLDTRDSMAVLVDNTPPTVAPLKLTVRGHRVQVDSRLSDALSPLTELTYALDGGTPRPILPQDGLLDGPSESVRLHLDDLAAGRHTLTLRVLDEAGNEGYGEASFLLP